MPRPRFDLADRLEHQAGNVENDGHLNAARYMREAAAVLRADDDTLYIRADIVERMAEALRDARDALRGADAWIAHTSGTQNKGRTAAISAVSSALTSYREASNVES